MKKKKKASEVKKLKKEIEEMKAGWQRTQADFDNFRKRNQDEMEKRQNNARIQVIMDLLPVFDNFERAYKHIPESDKEKEWVQGIIAIEKQFHAILSQFGVEKYHVKGKKFDPQIADAMFYEHSSKKEGVILEEIEPGYKIGEEIIRHARVKVSKGRKSEIRNPSRLDGRAEADPKSETNPKSE